MCVSKLAKVLIRLLLPLMLAMASVAAFGRETADLAPTSAPPSSESESEAMQREIEAFAYTQISARRAIAIAERRGPGAKVVDLSFDGSTSHPAYGVKVLLNGELWEGTIDASTGLSVGSGSTTPVSSLRQENQTTLAAFAAAGIDLSETIAIAEQYGSGKAVSAGLQHDGAKLVLLVVIVCDGSLKEIAIEPPESRSRGRKSSQREKKAPQREKASVPDKSTARDKSSTREKKWKRPSSVETSRSASA